MSDIQGTGIGLSVSKSLVELMNGVIGAQSKPGEGSLFGLELPMAKMQAKEELPFGDRAVGSSNVVNSIINSTALYVEDNVPNIKLMEVICDGIDGLNLITTKTAEEGIELAIAQKPDIIILDVNLPGMSGIDAMKIIRESLSIAAIPVIGLSASAMQEDIEKGNQAGFYKYMTKPLDVAILIQTLETLLKN